MSIELLYTSAPQGLKQGSRGFCTVISTSGMPSNLAQRLEALSGYRHVYPPQDMKADRNPVCFSHLRMTVGGQSLSVLSRISAYGVDYSQRTNKIAHHVVLNPSDLVAAGPGWLSLQPDFFRSHWDGQCATPASGPQIPRGDVSAKPCSLWDSVMGDAGWGGVVASHWLNAGSKPLWIVFPEGMGELLLPLLSEAIALLPVNKRWLATYSTYCTNLPPEVDCKVRCVLQGTDEARLAPAKGTLIDLANRMGVAFDGHDIEAARTGTTVGQNVNISANEKQLLTENSPHEHSRGHVSRNSSTLNAVAVTQADVAGRDLFIPPPISITHPNANNRHSSFSAESRRTVPIAILIGSLLLVGAVLLTLSLRYQENLHESVLPSSIASSLNTPGESEGLITDELSQVDPAPETQLQIGPGLEGDVIPEISTKGTDSIPAPGTDKEQSEAPSIKEPDNHVIKKEQGSPSPKEPDDSVDAPDAVGELVNSSNDVTHNGQDAANGIDKKQEAISRGEIKEINYKTRSIDTQWTLPLNDSYVKATHFQIGSYPKKQIRQKTIEIQEELKGLVLKLEFDRDNLNIGVEMKDAIKENDIKQLEVQIDSLRKDVMTCMGKIEKMMKSTSFDNVKKKLKFKTDPSLQDRIAICKEAAAQIASWQEMMNKNDPDNYKLFRDQHAGFASDLAKIQTDTSELLRLQHELEDKLRTTIEYPEPLILYQRAKIAKAVDDEDQDERMVELIIKFEAQLPKR